MDPKYVSTRRQRPSNKSDDPLQPFRVDLPFEKNKLNDKIEAILSCYEIFNCDEKRVCGRSAANYICFIDIALIRLANHGRAFL